jgi:hypothetical protein
VTQAYKSPWDTIPEFSQTITIDDITVPFERIPVQLLDELKGRFPEFMDKDHVVDRSTITADQMRDYQVAVIVCATQTNDIPAARTYGESRLRNANPLHLSAAFLQIMKATIPGFGENLDQPSAAGAAPTTGNRKARRTSASNAGGRKPATSRSSAVKTK